MTLNALTPDLVSALETRLPPGTLAAPAPAYLEEPRGLFAGRAGAVARPRTTDEVAALIRFCADHRVAVIPYAGGTGLVGGQIRTDGPDGLLLSVERLNRVRSVNPDDNVLVAEAGVILADVQSAAEAADRLFPLSIAAEGSARIGGNLATNAGGVQVLRYGNARDLCLGLEAVLADGSILNGLSPLRKDNTGYDLRNLLIGSEGTLGIITAASLKLFPRPAAKVTALAAVAGPSAALDLLHLCQKHLGDALHAFELMHRQGLDFLAETIPETPQPFPEPPEWTVLLEAGGAAGGELDAALERALSDALEAGLVADALIAQNAGQAAAFWEVRERIPEANRKIGAISSHDVSLPLSRVATFIARAPAELARIDPGMRINCFGHLGDGNLHYNLFPARGRPRSDYAHLQGAVKACVHDLVHALGGSVSAEHGIGRLKTGDLAKYGDPAKLAAMRAIKAALDPLGILNPGAVLPEA